MDAADTALFLKLQPPKPGDFVSAFPNPEGPAPRLSCQPFHYVFLTTHRIT